MPSPIQAARQLRQKMTPVEKVLWYHLRNYRFKKWKFRRQHPIVHKIIDGRKYFYVADFYCPAEKLVVELDGKHHLLSEQRIYDQVRDKIMNEMGIRILRIQNDEFFPLSRTLEKIEAALSPPSRLYGEGGDSPLPSSLDGGRGRTSND